ncbi:MAG: peroxiredoxin [Calditrichaeota bacterium]|nr:MAG: peroxiredoxin [Calditrichota bacterium]MBL1204831.1 peroxiredoxin [Calditrichota bacterium]NOG44660.1 peroxiredoxin [Calditrichota bacterium]
MFSFLFGGTDLKIGDKAPSFELKDGNGKLHKLSDYKGKNVALYFYPKDDTPGCTAEACNLRDNYTLLQDSGVVILGVSYDDSTSHQQFSKKYNLPFPLLSDTETEVSEAYGAKRILTGIFMPTRITYLIDKDGTIMHIFDEVESANHTAQIMSVLRK